MAALIRARLAPQPAHRTMVHGIRLGGEEARAAGVVDAVAPEDAVLEQALTRAAALAPKAGPAMGAIKASLYGAAGDALREAVG